MPGMIMLFKIIGRIMHPLPESSLMTVACKDNRVVYEHCACHAGEDLEDYQNDGERADEEGGEPIQDSRPDPKGST
ncbi:MAG: hypothetical protein M1269_12895 [Chloroflexi bacterium]|nr:hypothetical protein [Chloroflexota bacterium]